MKITIDTTKNCIIVPKTFFKMITDKNKTLEEAGVGKDKLITNEGFIRDALDKALKDNGIIRPKDL